MSESKLKPCPLCGCSMKIRKGKYPNGDPMIEPYGWHDEDCPLSAVSWYIWQEDGWTEERIAEAWNKRTFGMTVNQYGGNCKCFGHVENLTIGR